MDAARILELSKGGAKVVTVSMPAALLEAAQARAVDLEKKRFSHYVSGLILADLELAEEREDD